MSSIAHDIKGMISGPCTYIEILTSRLGELQLAEGDVKIIHYLKEDIDSIRDFVMEMNQLVSNHVTEKKTLVKVSQSLKSIKQIFKSKIKNTHIELIGDLTLYTRIDYLNRILINSIINSCEAIQKNEIENGKITIYCEEGLLGIADNSGEQLDRKTLGLLNSTQVIFSKKAQGSGLGILLIKDYVKMMGGKFKYTNHTQGVSLEIQFPKSICKMGG